MNLRPAVLGIYINEQKQFLIGPSPRDGGYKFPQGGKDEGETSLETLYREAFEETGCEISQYEIKDPKLKVSYKFSSKAKKIFSKEKYMGQEMEVFYIKVDSTFNPQPQDEEFEKFMWITIDEFENFDFRHRKEAYKKALEYCSYLK